jgi:hypothetical protein
MSATNIMHWGFQVESHGRQLEDDLRALEQARVEENMPPLSGEQQRSMFSEGYDVGRPSKRCNESVGWRCL